MTYVYLIACRGFHKIGVADDPVSRLAGMQIGCPFELRLVCSCSFPNRSVALTAEADLHRKLDKHKKHGEWFKLPKGMAGVIMNDMIANAG